jgi:hypothetical protein
MADPFDFDQEFDSIELEQCCAPREATPASDREQVSHRVRSTLGLDT